MTWMDGIASISIGFIMVLITVDVLCRILLNKPLVGIAEIVSSIIIIICFLESPYVSIRKAHVRTTILYDKVGYTGKRIINLIAAILGIFVYICIIHASFPGFLNALKINEAEIAGSTRITTIPGRSAIIFGSIFMIIEFINQVFSIVYELILCSPAGSDV